MTVPADIILLTAGVGLFALLLAAHAWQLLGRQRLPLPGAIRQFLASPALADEEQSRQAALLAAIIKPVFGVALLLTPLIGLLVGGRDGLRLFTIGLWANAVLLLLHTVVLRGQLRLARQGLPLAMFLILTWALGTTGSLQGPALSGYVVVVIIAALLLGGRGGVLYALLSAAAMLVLYVVGAGSLSGLGITPAHLGTWLVYAASLGVSALLLALAARRLQDGLIQANNLRAVERAQARDLSVALEAAQKRARQMALLADSARQLSGLTDPEGLMRDVVRRVAEGLPCEAVQLYLVEDQALVLRAAHDLPEAEPPPSPAPDQGLVAWTARAGEAGWVQDASADERYSPPGRTTVACAIAAPLRLAKNVVGVLAAESTRPQAFEASDVNTLESLADLIVAGLQTRQLFGELQQRQQMTEALRRIGAVLNTSLELPLVLDTGCAEIAAAFSADEVEVWLLDSAASQLLLAAECGRLGRHERPAAAVDLADETPLARAVRETRTLVLAGQAAGAHLDTAQSLIITPLRQASGEQPLGTLVIAEAKRARRLADKDAAAAELLATQLAACIQNARLYADHRRRAEQLALLHDITRASLEIGDYERLLDTLADRLVELVAADGCYLTRWDEAERRATPASASAALRALNHSASPGPRPGQPSLTEAALLAGSALVVEQALDSPYIDPEQAAERSARAMLALPLIAGDQPLGAALITFDHPHAFKADEIAYAEQAARQIALALARARALEAERRRNDELETLRQASLHLTSTLQLPRVLEAILQQALKLAAAQDAHLFLYDGEKLTFGQALWADGAQQTPFSVPRRGGLTDHVARSGQRIVVPNVNAHPLFANWPWGGAIVGLPLRIGDRVRGVMNVAFARPRDFDQHELRVLELLADQAAIALENARLFEAERQQRELAQALHEASTVLSETLEYESLLDRLLDQAERVLRCDVVAILLVDGDGGRVRVARQRPGPGSEPEIFAWDPNLAIDVGSVATLRELADNRPVVIADTASYAGWTPVTTAPSVRSWIGVPILVQQRLIAFFALGSRTPNDYQPAAAKRLAALAGQAALALQNARLFEAERRRAAQLSLLAEVSQQVADTLDETELLHRVVSSMVLRLGFAEAAISVPVGGDELEVVVVETSEPMAAAVGFRQKIGHGIAGHAAATLATYWSNDVGQDPYYFDATGRREGSALALPLQREGVLLGVLYLETSLLGAFGTPEIVAFETLASHVATAMENARLYARASDRLRDMIALQAVSQTMVSFLDLDHVIRTVVHLLHDTFKYPQVSLYQLQGDRLQLREQVGYPAERVIWEMTIDRGVMGRTVRTRQTQFVQNVAGDPDFLRASSEIRSEICVPLLKDQVVLGVLNVESGAAEPLTEADVSLLTTLAGQVTVAIENARLFTAEREQRELAEALRQAGAALSSSLDFETILDRLLDLIERVVPYDAACLFLVGPAPGRAHVARQRGFDRFGQPVATAMASLVLDVAVTPNLAHMALTGQPAIVPDTSLQAGWQAVAATPYVRSWAGAPILAQGEVIGFFSLDKVEPGFYRAWHAERLQAFAGQAALTLQNARLYVAQQRRAEDQRLLWLASRDFTAGLSERAVLQAVVRHMTGAMRAAGCTVSLWDRAKDLVVTLVDYATPALDLTDDPGTRYALSDYPATRAVLERRQPLIVRADDPAADPAERAFLLTNGHASSLMLPLDTGEQVFGLLEVYRDGDAAAFTEAEQHLAQSLAAQAAVALENARLHTALQENLAEVDALLKANEVLLRTLELDPLLDNILTAAVAAIPAAEKGLILLAGPAPGEPLAVRAVHGYADPQVRTLALEWDEGYAGQVVRENRPLLVDDTRGNGAHWHDGGLVELASVRSLVVAPLSPKETGAKADGAISLQATQPGAFTEADLRLLDAFANAAAVAIDNARLHAEVHRLAVTDSLTGLANPRAFEQALGTEFARAQRYGHALSLIIMDIDSFKQYNDTYGHPAGNERLKAIADVLRENVREPDLPVRYGGEEFALLLPHTVKTGALVLAERIRGAAEAAAPLTPAPREPVSGYTLSLGVAAFPADAETADALIVAADNAELAAKRAGKNRVCPAAPLSEREAEEA